MLSHGSEVPGFLRLYAGDVERIGREGASRFALYLDNVVSVRPDLVDDILRTYGDKTLMTREGVLNALAFPASYPTNWSLTDETAPIRYLGVPDARDMASRLRALAKRYPTVYGSATIATP
jgi:hypothetical protein